VIESGGGLIVSAKAFDAVCDALSVTLAVKFALPAVVGVPLITPAGLSASPAGSDPAVIDHV